MSVKVSVIIPVYNVEFQIEQMLESVRNQIFTDFEVIIINDGSTDGSQQIVDKICKEDDRFKAYYQTNQGVSAARNRGLDLAQGEYVVFYDPDDYIPENALQSLYLSAREELADLVVGVMEIHSLGNSYISSHTENLAEIKEIDPFDENFNWTFSVCNKMFSKKMIDVLNLRFESLSNGEDAVFVFEFVHNCNRITGCKEVVYDYIKRPFWEKNSATQSASMQGLEDLIKVFDRLIEIVQKSYEEKRDILTADRDVSQISIVEFDNHFYSYKSNLYTRFVQGILIGEYYRRIWKMDSHMLKIVEKRVLEYKSHIFPREWETKVLGRNKDLRLEKKIFLTHQELSEEPIVSFVISSCVPESRVNKVIAGLYDQNLPAFEILIDDKLEDYVEQDYKEKENFHTIEQAKDIKSFKETALNVMRGEYVMYIDEPVLMSRTIVKDLYGAIKNRPRTLFVTVPLKGIIENEYQYVEANQVPFIREFVFRKIRTPYNQLDNIWGNKLFRVKDLKVKKVLFSNNPIADIDRLYNNSNYLKKPELNLATTITNEDILNNVKNIYVKIFYKVKLKSEKKSLDKREKEKDRIVTVRQKWRRWKEGKIRELYHCITRKVIFPLQYMRYKGKPVQSNKVVFVEPRLKEISNSLRQILNYFDQENNYEIHKHFLGEVVARYRMQFKNTMAFIKDMATARYVFMAEGSMSIGGFKKRKETIVVQTWHGCGAFKKFGFSTAGLIHGDDSTKQMKYPMYRNCDIVTVSSPDVVGAYEEAMGMEDSNIVKPLGVSRTDVFFDNKFIDSARDRVHRLIPQIFGKKVIVYAPTFRGTVDNAEAPKQLDIARLSEELSDEYVLLIKHHPIVQRIPEVPANCRGSFAFDVTDSVEIDELLCVADICISDYSSLVFEYSLFEKPLIFFAYDLGINFDSRGFYYAYNEMVPGPIVVSTEEIIQCVKNIDEQFDKQRVIDFKRKFMSACDGHATERIISEIKK